MGRGTKNMINLLNKSASVLLELCGAQTCAYALMCACVFECVYVCLSVCMQSAVELICMVSV